ncbi:glycosyltransferase [Cohnella ginsengisoli]|uniref:Glycosyltransferase n=1 Tax=Cohnella ginsengisoli TaxID=425004 RepID=A0A9X4KMP1_9BACL|nr:glycosyltransferase family 2 protein [Cohnella ginsengisoli]MDG0794521.1 glycosyltransferase [Cohnella ginsengisoli]
MKVSVILPTLNAEKYLVNLIGKLQEQTLRPHEILVVDSRSDDGTLLMAKRLGAKVMSVERKDFDHGGTRNLAAQKTTGDVLVYMTQDAVPQHDRFIEEIVAPFADTKVAAVCGRQIARAESNVLERMTRDINYPELYIHKTLADLDRFGIKLFFFTNVCSAIRRDVFLQLGGFPAPIILNEDMMIAAKCITNGYAVVYNPRASVIHSHDYSLKKQFKRNFDIGVSMRMNEWIFQYARAEKEGGRLVSEQLGRLWKQGNWTWIPRWIAEAGAKYVGYRFGVSYKKLPVRIRRKFSMHPDFWLNYDKSQIVREAVIFKAEAQSVSNH